MTSRSVAPTSSATSYIFLTPRMPFGKGFPFSSFERIFSSETTLCVVARLPDDSKTINRSPTISHTIILQKVAMLSGPALVRESEAKTMPFSTRAATQ